MSPAKKPTASKRKPRLKAVNSVTQSPEVSNVEVATRSHDESLAYSPYEDAPPENPWATLFWWSVAGVMACGAVYYWMYVR